MATLELPNHLSGKVQPLQPQRRFWSRLLQHPVGACIIRAAHRHQVLLRQVNYRLPHGVRRSRQLSDASHTLSPHLDAKIRYNLTVKNWHDCLHLLHVGAKNPVYPATPATPVQIPKPGPDGMLDSKCPTKPDIGVNLASGNDGTQTQLHNNPGTAVPATMMLRAQFSPRKTCS